LQIEVNAVNEALAAFHRAYDGNSDAMEWLRSAERRIGVFTGRFNLLQEQLTAELASRTQFKQVHDFLTSISDDLQASPATFKDNPNYTTTKLPMAYYANKQVTETITCKDVLTQSQAFDAITFTAFYENLPKLDFSAGAVLSLIHGHQVGPVSGPCPSIASCGTASPNTLLAVTNYSRVQWIPGAFFEFHPWNCKCPWATNGASHHYFGYVCSIGPAFGLLVNPNNGTTAAEYFEGISFGIHRVAIFVGNHTGHYQEFSEGYAVGEVVPSGLTPPTHRYWTNHLAFGISYRIPLR
jgi:hypothetical protein